MAILTDMPDEILLEIFKNLDNNKRWLRNVCLTSPKLKPAGEECLYNHIYIELQGRGSERERHRTFDVHTVLPLRHLLRTLIARPDLAAHIKIITTIDHLEARINRDQAHLTPLWCAFWSADWQIQKDPRHYMFLSKEIEGLRYLQEIYVEAIKNKLPDHTFSLRSSAAHTWFPSRLCSDFGHKRKPWWTWEPGDDDEYWNENSRWLSALQSNYADAHIALILCLAKHVTRLNLLSRHSFFVNAVIEAATYVGWKTNRLERLRYVNLNPWPWICSKSFHKPRLPGFWLEFPTITTLRSIPASWLFNSLLVDRPQVRRLKPPLPIRQASFIVRDEYWDEGFNRNFAMLETLHLNLDPLNSGFVPILWAEDGIKANLKRLELSFHLDEWSASSTMTIEHLSSFTGLTQLRIDFGLALRSVQEPFDLRDMFPPQLEVLGFQHIRDGSLAELKSFFDELPQRPFPSLKMLKLFHYHDLRVDLQSTEARNIKRFVKGYDQLFSGLGAELELRFVAPTGNCTYLYNTSGQKSGHSILEEEYAFFDEHIHFYPATRSASDSSKGESDGGSDWDDGSEWGSLTQWK